MPNWLPHDMLHLRCTASAVCGILENFFWFVRGSLTTRAKSVGRWIRIMSVAQAFSAFSKVKRGNQARHS